MNTDVICGFHYCIVSLTNFIEFLFKFNRDKK